MSIAIEVDSLSKKYRLGEYQAAYGTLRETLVHATRRLAGREHHRPEAEIWALRDVSFEVPEGQVLVMGDHRGRSFDGRYFGLVPAKALYARAVGVYWRSGEGPVWKKL